MPVFNPPNFDPQLTDFELRLTDLEGNYTALEQGLFDNQTATATAQAAATNAQQAADDAIADIAALQAELGGLLNPIAVASFNGVSGSVAWRQKLDPQGIITSLTRTSAGSYTISVTGMTADALISQASTAPFSRFTPASGSVSVLLQNTLANNTDFNYVSFAIYAL
jgi:hypothetical protein